MLVVCCGLLLIEGVPYGRLAKNASVIKFAIGHLYNRAINKYKILSDDKKCPSFGQRTLSLQ